MAIKEFNVPACELVKGSIVQSQDGYRYVVSSLMSNYKLVRFVKLADGSVMMAPLTMMFKVLD